MLLPPSSEARFQVTVNPVCEIPTIEGVDNPDGFSAKVLTSSLSRDGSPYPWSFLALTMKRYKVSRVKFGKYLVVSANASVYE